MGPVETLNTPCDVQIVIPTRNNCEVLRRCLASARQYRRGARTEVWVVDNASSDATVSMLRQEFPEVRVIASDVNLYFTPANKLAVRQSSSKYVMLLNDDTELLTDAVQQMFEFMESHQEAGSCGCRLLNPDRSWRQTSYAMPNVGLLIVHFLGLSSLLRRVNKKRVRQIAGKLLGRNTASYLDVEPGSMPREVEVVSGACLFFRRAVMESVGEMDGNFKLGPDDWDWCLRMKARGWKVYLLSAGVQVVHLGGVSTGQGRGLASLEFYRGWFYFCVKHYGLTGRVFLSVLVPATLLVRMLPLFGAKCTSLRRIGEVPKELLYHLRLCRISIREGLLKPRVAQQ